MNIRHYVILGFLLTGVVSCGASDSEPAASDNTAETKELDRDKSDHPATQDTSAPSVETTTAAKTSDLWDTKLVFGSTPETPAAGLERGRQVYEQWCVICHGTGPGMAGTESLMRKYKGTDIPALLIEREDLYPAVTKSFVRNGIKSMPHFRKTEITDKDLELLAAYLAPKDQE